MACSTVPFHSAWLQLCHEAALRHGRLKMNVSLRRFRQRRGSILHRRCSTTRRIIAGLTSVAFSNLIVLPPLPSTVHAASQRKIYFYHPDHLGSTSLVTDEQGQVVEHTEYKPFGEVYRREIRDPSTGQLIVGDMSSAVSPFGFTGQRLDNSTGLYYYNGRYYDAQLGRFIQPDPTVQRAGDPQDLNRYTYARNNPVNNIDPTGHGWFKKMWGQVVSVIVGVGTTLATGGNFLLGFQAYNLSNTLIGTGQALASGVSAGRVFGALAAGAAISAAFAGIGVGGIGNLGFRMAAFAEQGALSGLTNSAILGGSLGEGAAWGAGHGALTGLVTSQQAQNWQAGNGFVSNEQFTAAQQQRLANGPQYGMAGLYSDQGHTFLGLADAHGENVIYTGKYYQGDSTFGNPSTAKLELLLGRTAKGVRGDETILSHLGTAKLVAKWNLTDGQYTALYSYMHSDPGTFALTTNCAAWALQGLRTAGIQAPSNLTTFSFTNPAQVMQWNGND